VCWHSADAHVHGIGCASCMQMVAAVWASKRAGPACWSKSMPRRATYLTVSPSSSTGGAPAAMGFPGAVSCKRADSKRWTRHLGWMQCMQQTACAAAGFRRQRRVHSTRAAASWVANQQQRRLVPRLQAASRDVSAEERVRAGFHPLQIFCTGSRGAHSHWSRHGVGACSACKLQLLARSQCGTACSITPVAAQSLLVTMPAAEAASHLHLSSRRLS